MSDHGDEAATDDRARAWVGTFLTGLAMGSADAVPGVSGGTIALIAGVYDRLVAAIAAFEPRRLREAVEGRDVRPLVELFVAMDVVFLGVLGLGVATGLASVARVVVFGYRQLPAVTYAFFFGLIAASAVVLFDQVALDRRREQVAAVVGAVLAFVLVGELQASLGQSPVVVLLVGAVSICAMILPGVSGSFVLLVFGLHDFMATKLTQFIDAVAALATGGPVDAVVAPGVYVVAYCTGAAVGLLSFARIVQAALERDRQTTITFLVALMVGSLRLPVREVTTAMTDDVATAGDGPVAVLVAALVGGALVLLLEQFTGGLGYEDG